jgi:hypothetical protein
MTVIPQESIVLLLVNEFPELYKSQEFCSVFKTVRRLSLNKFNLHQPVLFAYDLF